MARLIVRWTLERSERFVISFSIGNCLVFIKLKMKSSTLASEITWMTAFFIISCFLYCSDESNLSGSWILDDKGTVSMNKVVLRGPWSDVWKKDFWGRDEPHEKKSHKSWRPLTTASYKLNHNLVNRYYGDSNAAPNPYWFHVVDRIINGLVSSLSFIVALCSLNPGPKPMDQNSSISFFDSTVSKALCAAALFSTHPIHVEAVANTTGRAETLCALFYFIGFWIYVRTRSFHSIFSNLFGITLVLLFTILATLSKEHGITLPILCLLWDFFTLQTVCNESNNLRKTMYSYALRLMYCIVGVICIGSWRLSKNGSSKPDFVCEQNPAACQENFIKRFLYLSYLWVYNFWLLLLPDALSPDRSGDSIPMFNYPLTDPRLPAVFIMWIVLAIFSFYAVNTAVSLIFLHLGTKSNDYSPESKLQLRTVSNIITGFLWMIVPFFMSSNMLVYVGFVVADRTLYLPSFGFCLLIVQLVPILLSYIVNWVKGDLNDFLLVPLDQQVTSRSDVKRLKGWNIHDGVYASVLVIILALYAKKVVRQTKRWSDPVLLWGEAYRLYPSSCINGKEYGMALVNAQRPKDAIPVLLDMSKREKANMWFTQTVESFRKEHFENSEKDPLLDYKKKLGEVGRFASMVQTRFKLVTAMGNIGRCDEANRIIDDSLTSIDKSLRELSQIKVSSYQDEEIKDSIDSTEEVMITNKAYLLVSKSRCAKSLLEMAKFAYAAVQISGIDYVLEHAKTVNDLVENARAVHVELNKVLIVRTVSHDGQSAEVSFALAEQN